MKHQSRHVSKNRTSNGLGFDDYRQSDKRNIRFGQTQIGHHEDPGVSNIGNEMYFEVDEYYNQLMDQENQ
jgi:hypothetical protein